jgi:hypothetical protein
MNIRDDVRWQTQTSGQRVVQLPIELVRDAMTGTISADAYITYAALRVGTGAPSQSHKELAALLGLTPHRLQKRMDELEAVGWLDRQTNGSPSVVLSLRFTRREGTA